MTLLILLLSVASVLTFALFHPEPKKIELGWPAVIFWALGGFQAYSLRTGTDMYFWLAFGCLLGMIPFVGISSVEEQRRRRENIRIKLENPQQQHQTADGRTENKPEEEQSDGMSHLEKQNQPSTATQRLHARADNRRNNNSRGRSLIRW